MLARNALVLAVATALTAAVAGAQAPAAKTKSSSTAQAPAAQQQKPAKSSTQKVAVSADSAKKIVMANAAGATISSTKLHHSEGKAYYTVSYHMKGDKATQHATVDANTGAFTQTPAKSSSKKSS